jgi:SAM-dependent methyltransferase
MVYKFFFSLSQKYLRATRNKYLLDKIDRTSKIADFGSGHEPFRYASVLVDKKSTDDIQRGGLTILDRLEGREFVDYDLNNTPYPFKDKEFDYAICSHVLEHLDDPVSALKEITRIAKAGYIEIPAFCSDIFMKKNDEIHKWLCLYDLLQKKLYFLDRVRFCQTVGFREMPIWIRFFLSLKVTRVLWRDGLAGECLTSPSWV